VLGGRYRVVGLLGRGGMGEVYRADDLKLGQPVALKFLPAIVEKDQARLQRFLNEVKIARHISHPNVCRVYDAGEVDGEDLASLLRRIGRLPKDKAVQISRQLCMGLAALEGGLVLLVLIRFGLLACFSVSLFQQFIAWSSPVADFPAWYAQPFVMELLAAGILAVYGFVISTAGRPIFREPILPE
jgi:hypothetical protein